MVNLELYRVFCEVAACGSFSQAAQRLYITQSAVSQTVRQLETQLGRPLFVRGRRGAALTAEGRMLYQHIAPALGVLLTGEERFERMRKLQEGELSIAANDTISAHFLLPVLERYHSLYPEVRLTVVNRTSGQALELLKTGAADVALANLPLPEDTVDAVECMAVHDVFVAGERFAHLRGKTLTPQQLAGCHLVMLETLSNSRRYVDAFFAANGARLQPEIELGAHNLLLEFAGIGLGVACVLREFSQEWLQSGRLFELTLERPVPPRAIGLCTPRGMPPSFAAQRFMELLPKRGGAPAV